MPIEPDRVDRLFNVIARSSDLTLVAGIDNTKFPVHREIILNNQPSKYFEALLGPNFREGTENEIILKGIDGPTLKAVIHYIYIGHIELNGENIECVLAAASAMELIALEKMCESYLDKILCKENLMDSLMLADKYNLLQLKTNALKKVRENFENIPIDDVLQMDGAVLTELLQSDDIVAPENHIFGILVQWSKNYREEPAQAKYVPELLKSIRLECLSAQLMPSTVEPFFRQHGCEDILMNEYRNRACYPQPIRPYRCSTSLSKNMFYAEFPNQSSITIYKYSTLPSQVKTGTFERKDQHFGVAFHGGDLYILGGRNSDIVFSRRAECYELSTWNRKTVPNMLTPRSHFTPVVFKNSIYVFGGSSQEVKNPADCERFDITNQRWEAITAMPRRLWGCIAIELKGQIYVAGGNDADCRFSNVIYRFQPDDYHGGKWEELTYLHESNGPILLAKSDEILYAIIRGSTIHGYDTKTNKWMKTRSLPGSAKILRTIDYFGQPYALYMDGKTSEAKFGKINFEDENVFGEGAVDAAFSSSYDGFLFVW